MSGDTDIQQPSSAEQQAALAREPYEAIATTADEVGKAWLATSIRKLGERAASQAIEMAGLEDRMRQRAERSKAFRDVCEAHPGGRSNPYRL